MARINHRRSRKAGLPAGSLVHIGDRKIERTRITVIAYDEETFREKEAKSTDECTALKDTAAVTWINIDGVHDSRLISDLGSHFGVHPLILEDVMTTAQRPKMEDMGGYIYIVLRMLDFVNGTKEVRSEQVSLILGPNFVISFQENKGDVFDPIRDRLRTAKGRVRKMGPDYLAYALIDAIVDNYFIILEKLGEDVEDVEQALSVGPTVTCSRRSTP